MRRFKMSNLSTVIPASEARKNFYTLLDEVGEKFKEFTITLRGKAKAVVMPFSEVEAWKETMSIMADKGLMSDIKEGLNDIRNGRVLSEKQLKKKLNS